MRIKLVKAKRPSSRVDCNNTLNFLMEHFRLCSSIDGLCDTCPLYKYCLDENHNNPELYKKKIKALQKWSDSNPPVPENNYDCTKTTDYLKVKTIICDGTSDCEKCIFRETWSVGGCVEMEKNEPDMAVKTVQAFADSHFKKEC